MLVKYLGFSHLFNRPGQEVKYVTCIDADHEENIDKSYLWTLEKLFEIPDYKPKEEFQ